MFSKLLTASSVDRVSDEDLCSQFNHMWSTLLLTAMALVISLVQFVGDPMHCLCPAQMAEVHCNYTKALCWVKQNYHVSPDEELPLIGSDRRQSQVAYYPWVPWILCLMASMFKVPHTIWKAFVPASDLNLERLVHSADDDADIQTIAKIIRIWLSRTKRHYTSFLHRAKKVLSLLGLFWFGRHKQTFLTGLLLLVKTCYLLISIGLFWSLNLFLDEDFTAYGWEVVQDFLHGLPQLSPRFPKQTICDITLRQLNNVNTYSLQCLLPINLYNQKIFLFLWFWLILLTMINSYSLAQWSLCLLSPSQRWYFLKRYVVVFSRIDQQEKRIARQKATRLNRSSTQLKSLIPNGSAIALENTVVRRSTTNQEHVERQESQLTLIPDDNTPVRPAKSRRKQPGNVCSIEINPHQLNEQKVRRNIH